MTKEQVLAFIKSKKHAVVSTCGSSHQPEAALIGFGQTDDLELFFGTYNTSKKYKNLKENDQVAFVIGWDDDYITVQYEGTATELNPLLPADLERYLRPFHQKTPGAAAYHDHPAQTYFKVTPRWIRYSDLSGEEEKVYEFTF